MQQYGSSKKRRKAVLFASYVAMTLAVIALSTVCILLVLGYRFDFASQSVEQGALLQFDSSPSAARITLDNKELSFTTPGKQNVSTGVHNVTISRDGYRSWSKQFTINAGEVRWLNYARLVPTTVETTSVKEFASLSSQLASPDRKWLFVLAKADTPTLTLVDLRNSDSLKYTDIAVPATALTMPADSTHSYEIVEWNFGSKYLLLKHMFATGAEYLRINREDANDIINISTKFGVNFSDIHFSSDNVFYGIENGNLRRFDLGASSLSEPIVTNVQTMKLYGSSDIGYVRHKDATLEAGVVIDNKVHTVSTYDDTVPLLVDISSYFNERYFAVTRGASFELSKNPQKTAGNGLEKIVTLSFPSDIKWLDISSSGRHVIAGNGTQFMTYDVELTRRTDTNLPGMQENLAQPPKWLDDFILVSTADNKLRISDFDGENQQIITDSLPNQPIVLSSDSKLLYSFTKMQTGTYSLQASKMLVE